MSQRDLVAELRGARIAAPAELREHVRPIAAGAPAPPPPLHLAPRARRRAAGRRGGRRGVLVVTRPEHQPDRDVSGASSSGPDRARREVARRRRRSRSRDRGTARRGSRRCPHPAACSGTARSSRCASRRPTASPTASSARCGSRRRSAATRPRCTRLDDGKAATRRPDAEDPARARPGGDHAAVRARHDHERAGRRPGRAGRPERDRPHDRAAADAARDSARARADRRARRRDRRAHRAHRAAAARTQAATIRAAHYATVQLHLETPPAAQPVHHGHGPLHGLGVAFRWIGIGAVYVLALGAPLVAARRARLARGARGPPAPRGRAAQPAVTCGRTPGTSARRPAARRTPGSTQPRSSTPALVGLLDLGLAHRQRPPHGADRTEAGLARLGRAEHVEVDLDLVHLLHAADVRVPPRLVRVDERAARAQARAGVDDLVAVHPAAAALHLVLRMERAAPRAAVCSGVMRTLSERLRTARKT